MTSIEWLIEQFKDYDFLLSLHQFDIEQAKEMHKQEIIDAYETSHISMMTSEQYYQETFVSKGNDETLKDYHIVESNEMVELPQQEISDEEIEKAAREYDNNVIYGPPLVHFEQGAFWYREQLKQRQ
jgi:hypothetical protein